MIDPGLRSVRKYPPLCAGVGCTPTKALAIQILIFCPLGRPSGFWVIIWLTSLGGILRAHGLVLSFKCATSAEGEVVV